MTDDNHKDKTTQAKIQCRNIYDTRFNCISNQEDCEDKFSTQKLFGKRRLAGESTSRLLNDNVRCIIAVANAVYNRDSSR